MAGNHAPDTTITAQEQQLEWQDRMACRVVDPDLFFPEKGRSAKSAKRVCMGCTVRVECLAYALSRRERDGVYGGLSPSERNKLLRRPGQEAAA